MSIIIKKFISILIRLDRITKQFLVLVLDLVLSLIASFFTFWLIFPNLLFDYNLVYLLGLFLFIPFFISFELYQAIFRFSSINTIKNVLLATLIYSVIFSIILTFSNFNISTNFAIVQPLIFFVLVTLSRLLISSIILNFTQDKNIIQNAVIYGAGSSGILISNLLKHYNILYFFDDDSSKWYKKINGIKILPFDSIKNHLIGNNISKIFVSIEKINLVKRREIISKFQDIDIPIRFLDNLNSLLSGDYNNDDYQLKIEDIILKNTNFNTSEVEKFINGKRIVVTGSGGSIGSELVRQIVRMSPNILLLIDNTEYNLYKIQQELEEILKNLKIKVKIKYLLYNICNENKLETLFKEHKPDIVYHAAAYKHVPLLEHNIVSAVENNIIGTLNLVKISLKHGVKFFTLISSDKAVRPTNIMGASKRFAELVIQANASKNNYNCKFSVVRFGNVLGSTGSVFPLFNKQISNGGPVTVTHPEVSRYFMTIIEAVGLILQSSIFSKGGEVFVLNMGESIKIIDLAEKMIKLSGKSIKNDKNPNGDIEINFIGLREGEKIHEEIFIGNDIEETEHKDIMKANEDFISLDTLEKEILNLEESIKLNKYSQTIKILEKCVNGFIYQSTSKN